MIIRVGEWEGNEREMGIYGYFVRMKAAGRNSTKARAYGGRRPE